MFRGLDVDALGLDRAYVNVSSGYGREAVYAYRRNANCDGCPFQRVGEVRKGWGWKVMRRKKRTIRKCREQDEARGCSCISKMTFSSHAPWGLSN